MGIVFGATQFFLKYVDITTLTEDITDDIAESGLHLPDHKLYNTRYPLCMLDKERDLLLDVAFMSHMIYQTPELMTQAMGVYFEGMYDTGMPWNIVTIPDSTMTPVFIHLQHKVHTKKHMIIVRG
eukprot:292913_1